MVEPCPAAREFRFDRRGVARPRVHGKADRLVLAQVARDVLDPGAPEIWTAAQLASRWLKLLGPPADSLAHPEAKGSNSVWEPQALRLRVASQRQRASPWRTLEKLGDARVQAQLQAASRRQRRAIVETPLEQLGAQPAWLRPDSARVK